MTVRGDLANLIKQSLARLDRRSQYVILCNLMDYEAVKRTGINMPIRRVDYVEQGTICLVNKYELERFIPDGL